MKASMNECCFPLDWDLEKKISIARVLDIDGIEFNVDEFPDEGNTLYLGMSDETLNIIREKMREHNLEIVSISTGLLWKYSLTDNSNLIREKAKKIIKEMIRIAKVLRIDTILIVPGVVTEEVPYELAYKRSYEALSELEEIAAKSKVVLALENVWNKFLLSPIEYREYIEKFNSDFIRVYFDVGNILLYGFPEQWISYLGKYIVRIHVKDFDKKIGNINGFCWLEEGDLNCDALRTALNEQQYDSYITAEISYDETRTEIFLKQIKEGLNILCR